MDLSSAGGGGRRINGVVIGVVTDNHHPEGLYMVRVKFPWIRDSTDAGDAEDFLSAWARVSTPMSGNERGFMFLPEKDDEVLVAFEHGDIRRPFVVGCLFNGKDLYPREGKPLADPTAPTTPTGSVDGTVASHGKTTDAFDSTAATNSWRGIVSRAGHMLMFHDGDDNKDGKVVLQTKAGNHIILSDKDGSEHIVISDKTGKNYAHIDTANNTINIETVDGDMNLFCKKGKFTLEAKEIAITANTGKTEFTSKSDFNIDTSAKMNATASSDITMKGSKINLN
jgi:uncharacterized protein involved in type VI secretion and phage assembly